MKDPVRVIDLYGSALTNDPNSVQLLAYLFRCGPRSEEQMSTTLKTSGAETRLLLTKLYRRSLVKRVGDFFWHTSETGESLLSGLDITDVVELDLLGSLSTTSESQQEITGIAKATDQGIKSRFVAMLRLYESLRSHASHGIAGESEISARDKTVFALLLAASSSIEQAIGQADRYGLHALARRSSGAEIEAPTPNLGSYLHQNALDGARYYMLSNRYIELAPESKWIDTSLDPIVENVTFLRILNAALTGDADPALQECSRNWRERDFILYWDFAFQKPYYQADARESCKLWVAEIKEPRTNLVLLLADRLRKATSTPKSRVDRELPSSLNLPQPQDSLAQELSDLSSKVRAMESERKLNKSSKRMISTYIVSIANVLDRLT